MQFDAGLIGEAAALAQEHDVVLARLPATVQAFILVELRKWPALFAPEQRYQRALLEHLARFSRDDLERAGAAIDRIEHEAGCHTIARGDPARFQDQAQALLRRHRLVTDWRQAVDAFFRDIDPAVESRLYPADAPHRLIVQIYGRGIAVQPEKLWSRFKQSGIRVPLKLDGVQESGAFLQALFGGTGGRGEPPFFAAARDQAGLGPLDAWMVEAHQALDGLWQGGAEPANTVTGLSYDRLRTYRTDLARALYTKVLSGVESPQAFAAYARTLKIAPEDGALTRTADVVQTFVRDVLLTGNGTLFVNNTFVEWSAVQALRRAQPRILVTRFGVRDRFRPFTSLVLFSQPRPSDRAPSVPDPAGSFIDVEQLSYYIWLNAEKSAAYRGKTLYLFLAEGADQMLAIRSDRAAAPTDPVPPASPSDVCATMRRWLSIAAAGMPGQAIAPLTA